MKHADSTEWSDYVRGLQDTETTSTMSTHLETGCRRCTAMVAVLRRVQSLAAADASSGPPTGAVRSVKAYFALQASESTSPIRKLAMRLVGDSSLQPAAVGVRHGGAEARSLTYQGSEHIVELRMTPESGSNEVRLAGEFRSESNGPLAGTPAFLLNQSRVVSHTSTNDLGAFSLAMNSEAASRLCLVLEDGATVTIGLPARDEANDA